MTSETIKVKTFKPGDGLDAKGSFDGTEVPLEAGACKGCGACTGCKACSQCGAPGCKNCGGSCKGCKAKEE